MLLLCESGKDTMIDGQEGGRRGVDGAPERSVSSAKEDSIDAVLLLASALLGSVLLEHGKRLLDLGGERVGRLDEMNDLLGEVRVEQHAGDLAGELLLAKVNERVELLAQHQLLLLGREFGDAFGVERRGGHLLHRDRHGVVDASGRRTLLRAASLLLLLLRRSTTHLLLLLLLLRLAATADDVASGWHRVLALRARPRLTRHTATRHHLLRIDEALLSGGGGRLAGRRCVEHRCAWRVHAGCGGGGGRDAWLGATLMLQLEVATTLLLRLRERDVDRLGAEHAPVHVGDGARRLLGGGEADEAEASRDAVVAHDAARGDRAVLLELVAQPLVIDRILEVLHVQIDALVLADALGLLLLGLLLQLGVALRLLLRAADVQHTSVVELFAVQRVDRLLRVLGVGKVDKAEAL
jgi:hypothetical protein